MTRPYHKWELALQTEFMWRLPTVGVLGIPVPNGQPLMMLAHTDEEREVVRRIIARMIAAGMLRPGACDLAVLNGRGGGVVELKKPATRDLFRNSPAGRLSDSQKLFREDCARFGVNWACVDNWADGLKALREWGMTEP